MNERTADEIFRKDNHRLQRPSLTLFILFGFRLGGACRREMRGKRRVGASNAVAVTTRQCLDGI